MRGGDAVAAGIAANKRRSENLKLSNEMLDAFPALADALLALFIHTAFYEHHYHPDGKRKLVALRKAAAVALHAAGRLP